MRVPKDIPLAVWIRQLYKQDKIYLFYKTDDWLELRQRVLDDNHNECIECVKVGKYSEADCVHHINEVRDRPDLALSRYYTDNNGQRQPNLVPLCNACHNIIHDKFSKFYNKDKFINEERW